MLTLPLEEIDKQEALRYMGCPAEPDKALRTIVDTCEQQLRRTVQPRVVYRVLPLCREAGTLSAGGMQLTGEDIARHLAECDRMLLMAATLSGQADQLIHRAVGVFFRHNLFYKCYFREQCCDQYQQTDIDDQTGIQTVHKTFPQIGRAHV